MTKFVGTTLIYKGSRHDLQVDGRPGETYRVMLNGNKIGEAIMLKQGKALATTLDDRWAFRGTTLEDVATRLCYCVLKERDDA